jgi:hypothetical protein
VNATTQMVAGNRFKLARALYIKKKVLFTLMNHLTVRQSNGRDRHKIESESRSVSGFRMYTVSGYSLKWQFDNRIRLDIGTLLYFKKQTQIDPVFQCVWCSDVRSLNGYSKTVFQ